MYYITVFVLTAAIILFFMMYQCSVARSHRLSLSQAYVNQIILQLQDDVILSDAAYQQYDSYVPMDLFLICGDTRTPFLSDGIKTPCSVLEDILQEQFQKSFEFHVESEAGSPEMLSHTFSFRADGLYGETFHCSHVSLLSASGRGYELYAASLINQNLFSPQEICQLGGFGILLFLSFGILGKHIIHASIAPINENMQKQKEFVASASHELKTPLSKIMIANQSAQIKNGQAIINAECGRMDQIIKNLLFIASSESCTWKTNFEPVDFVNLCVAFYEMSTPVLAKNGRELHLEFPEEDIAPISADRGLILQLFAILLDNAITYSGGNAPISVRLIPQKKNLSILFIDHGRGIPDEIKPKIFSSFYKADASTPGHYGLGLSIAKNIVALHHGKMTVSDTPGGGATFEIQLPSG